MCRQCACGQICRSSGAESIAFGKLLQAGLIEMVQQRSASGKVANVPGADLLLAFESIRAGKEPEFTFTAVVEGSGRHACDPNELTLVSCRPLHDDALLQVPFAGLLLRDAREAHTVPKISLSSPLGRSSLGPLVHLHDDELVAQLLCWPKGPLPEQIRVHRLLWGMPDLDDGGYDTVEVLGVAETKTFNKSDTSSIAPRAPDDDDFLQAFSEPKARATKRKAQGKAKAKAKAIAGPMPLGLDLDDFPDRLAKDLSDIMDEHDVALEDVHLVAKHLDSSTVMEEQAEEEEKAELKKDEEKYGKEKEDVPELVPAGPAAVDEEKYGKEKEDVPEPVPAGPAAVDSDYDYQKLLTELGLEEGSTIGTRFELFTREPRRNVGLVHTIGKGLKATCKIHKSCSCWVTSGERPQVLSELTRWIAASVAVTQDQHDDMAVDLKVRLGMKVRKKKG